MSNLFSKENTDRFGGFSVSKVQKHSCNSECRIYITHLQISSTII